MMTDSSPAPSAISGGSLPAGSWWSGISCWTSTSGGTGGGSPRRVRSRGSPSAGARVAGFGGVDPAGREIVRMLQKRGMGVSGLVSDPDRPTTVKTRVIAHQQQVVRVDRENREIPTGKARGMLVRRVLAALDSADGVVLSDYRKGALSPELVEAVIGAARKRGVFGWGPPSGTPRSLRMSPRGSS